jgi:hypothetical protein
LNASSVKRRHLLGAAIVALCVAGCGESKEEIANDGLAHLTAWFEVAARGERDDEHCHAFGLLKHREATCGDMLEHASRIVQSERTVTSTRFMECLETVCGEFFEVELASVDAGGREVEEIAVLKRDSGQFRVYWYRTNSLLTAIEDRQAAEDSIDAGADAKLESAYTRLTNEFPEFYQYPPCRGVRVSSSNLVGALLPPGDTDPGEFATRAEQCPDTFCIAFVGKKIGAVCPR